MRRTQISLPEDSRDPIDAALGAWTERDFDGETYVEVLRSGERLHPPEDSTTEEDPQ